MRERERYIYIDIYIYIYLYALKIRMMRPVAVISSARLSWIRWWAHGQPRDPGHDC